MGTRIIAKDADAEDTAAEYLASVRRGLEAIHLLNKSAAKAAKNYAPGKPNGVFVGSPLAAGGADMQLQSLSAYVQTQVVEAERMTIFGVVRSTDTFAGTSTRPMYWGTFQSPAAAGGGDTYGVGCYSNASNQHTGTGGKGTSHSDHTSGPASIAGTVGNWALLCHEVGVGTGRETRITNMTTGASAITSNGLPRFLSTGRLRIGSGYTSFAGQSNMALWWAHSVLLTTDEIAAVAVEIRALMARRGITV
ncbi:hypothetical protein ACLBXM_20045 [Xanthobacteraceae bacterium A53D]